MPRLVRTEDLPPDTWVGLGDDRRYLLAYDEQGWLWPWAYLDGRWFHTLDPTYDGKLWHVGEAATLAEIDGLHAHVNRIHVEGCGAMGWCRHHPKPEAR